MRSMKQNVYNGVIKGEVEIIHEEIENFKKYELGPIFNISDFLNGIKIHLLSIEKKNWHKFR